MNEQKQNAKEEVQQGGFGRRDQEQTAAGDQQQNSAAQRGHSRDISEIDRQEGNMNHGSLGGNFAEEDEQKGK